MCQKLLNLSFGPDKVTPVADSCDTMLRASALLTLQSRNSLFQFSFHHLVKGRREEPPPMPSFGYPLCLCNMKNFSLHIQPERADRNCRLLVIAVNPPDWLLCKLKTKLLILGGFEGRYINKGNSFRFI